MADTGNRRPIAVRASQSLVEGFDTSLSITSSTERRNGPIRSKIGSMNNISHRPGGGHAGHHQGRGRMLQLLPVPVHPGVREL